ncbi:MAG: HK97 gp10 family phage protein [Alphaproteobacteria bacterium]
MKFTAQLRGIAELNARLASLAKSEGLTKTLQSCAEDALSAARANLSDGTPPDSRTGALARSLSVTPSADGSSVTVSTPLTYGWYLEYGVLTRSATPWLAPALDDAAPSIKVRFGEWLDAVVRD